MTYYEELGIRPDATFEEIRQAYRSMARLLHPDQQQDDDLKFLAERQMRRLNEILALLTDTGSRRAYDRELAPARSKPILVLAAPPFGGSPLRQWRKFSVWDWFWVFIGVTNAGLLLWYITTSPVRTSVGPGGLPEDSKPKDSMMERAAPTKAVVPVVESAQGSRPVPLRAAKAEKQMVAEAPAELPSPEAAPPALVEVSETPPTTLSIEPRIEPARQQPAPQQAVIPRPEERFQGLWLYVPGSGPGSKLRYQPVFIEMTVIEDQTKLRGSYRARYRVPDEPVSSEVSFQFEGDKRDGKIRWQSADGGRGEGLLELLSGDSLDVKWWTTVSSARAKLASGSAVLVKQGSR